MIELERLGVRADLARPTWLALDDRIVDSALALLGVLLLRWALTRAIRGRGGLLSDNRRRALIWVKNAATAMIALLLVLIWGDSIQRFALSLAALAAAAVIATRELILNLLVGIWRTFARPFRVGDWIEIGAHSGIVIDETPITTLLQELDPRDLLPTGRIVSAPNALLLTQPVLNHDFRKRFLYLDFPIYSEPRADAEAQRARIEAAVIVAAADFAELARRYAQRIEAHGGMKLRDAEPRVTLETTELAKLVFHVTLFCPREQAAAMRQAAMAAFEPVGPPC